MKVLRLLVYFFTLREALVHAEAKRRREIHKKIQTKFLIVDGEWGISSRNHCFASLRNGIALRAVDSSSFEKQLETSGEKMRNWIQ